MENEGVLVISLDKLFEGTFGGKKQDIVIILNNWKNHCTVKLKFDELPYIEDLILIVSIFL